MDIAPLPPKVLEVLLQDTVNRDTTTARRTNLVKILLHERYLTRQQLIVRVEGLLGKGCFGASAWQNVFFRDMQTVKKALKAAGYQLAYSRSPVRPGYYLHGQPAVSAELYKTLKQIISEIDPNQIKIISKLTPAERYFLGSSITDAALSAVTFVTQQRHPNLTLKEASFLAIQGKLPNE